MLYSPTHLQVTVQRAKGLLTKGKNGKNNCFVTIALGKEKYQTSLKENATESPEWHEECELAIPSQGNRAELTLTCLHRNSFGMDEFLGQVTIPLSEMNQFERVRSRWYKLLSKPGKAKEKERGELEARIVFTVKAGSLSDLSKKDKNKSSLSNIAQSVGGSLLSLGAIEKRKGLKKFAKSLGSKVNLGKKKDKKISEDADSYSGSFSSVSTPNTGLRRNRFDDNNADPGVISEDEDEFVFDNLSHKSSGSSLNVRSKASNLILTNDKLDKEEVSSPAKPPRNFNDSSNKDLSKVDDWESKLYGKQLEIGSTDSLKRRSWENSRVPFIVQEEHVQEPTEKTIMEESEDKSLSFSSSTTAPVTPSFAERRQQKIAQELEDLPKPKPLPRVSTVADATMMYDRTEKSLSPVSLRSEKPEKQEKHEKPEKDNIFSKKLKYFRKESPQKTGSTENLRSSSLFNKSNSSSMFKNQSNEKRIIIGEENGMVEKNTPRVSKEVMAKYDGKSKEEIMLIAHSFEGELCQQKAKIKELEEYLDVLLLKVMETHPRILQNPFSGKGNSIKQSG